MYTVVAVGNNLESKGLDKPLVFSSLNAAFHYVQRYYNAHPGSRGSVLSSEYVSFDIYDNNDDFLLQA
jgi:hypothetical protein